MPDNEEEENDSDLPDGFVYMSPMEYLQKIAEDRTHALMTRESIMLRIENFIDALSMDDMHTFGLILDRASVDKGYAHRVYGQTVTYLKLKYGACEHCGTKHDTLAYLAAENPAVGEEPVLPEGPVEAEEPVEAQPALTEDDVIALMAEYGVRPATLAQGTLSVKTRVICINCSAPSVTLEDRMLRSPGIEGCGSCIYKQKWG